MKTKISRPRLPAIACPHCNGRAIVRTSEQMTLLCRQLRLRCDNDACGHAFVADISIVRTVRPSACPNPNVHLPISVIVAKPANDDAPIAANDTPPQLIEQSTGSAGVRPNTCGVAQHRR